MIIISQTIISMNIVSQIMISMNILSQIMLSTISCPILRPVQLYVSQIKICVKYCVPDSYLRYGLNHTFCSSRPSSFHYWLSSTILPCTFGCPAMVILFSLNLWLAIDICCCHFCVSWKVLRSDCLNEKVEIFWRQLIKKKWWVIWFLSQPFYSCIESEKFPGSFILVLED